MRVSPALVCALIVAGCTPLPQGAPGDVAAEAMPQLLPIDQLLAEAADTPGGASAVQGDALAARAARLRARAGLLRNPVVQP